MQKSNEPNYAYNYAQNDDKTNGPNVDDDVSSFEQFQDCAGIDMWNTAHYECPSQEDNLDSSEACASGYFFPGVSNNQLEAGPQTETAELHETARNCDSPVVKWPHAPHSMFNDDNDDIDDGQTCPICLEKWEISGDHRLVALRCGHLFGNKCIRRWLNESLHQTGVRRCPQCKKKVVPKDMLYIYAKRLQVIDRTEMNNLEKSLQMERSANRVLMCDITTLRENYEAFKRRTEEAEAASNRMNTLIPIDRAAEAENLFQMSYRAVMQGTTYLSHNFANSGVMYSNQKTDLIVSHRSSQRKFTGYGMQSIDLVTFYRSQFLYTSSRPLLDICLTADQNLAGATCLEKRMQIFDLRSNCFACTFAPAQQPLWSCAMDRNVRRNSLYLGACDGTVHLYDMRYPRAVLEEYTTAEDCSPAIKIEPVYASDLFPYGGFLVCKQNSLWFHEYDSYGIAVTTTQLSVEGPFIAMRFDAARNSLVLTCRHMTPCTLYGVLKKISSVTVFEVKSTLFGSCGSSGLAGAAQIPVETTTLIAGYVRDERVLAFYDTAHKQRLQSLTVRDGIYDSCYVYLPKFGNYLTTLSGNKFRIYKLQPVTLGNE